MKTDKNMENSLPPALLAEMAEVAAKEHRVVQDILREAVEFYLERRRYGATSLDDPAERARTFEVWMRNHPDTPPLPDEAVQRENLIRDDR